MPLIPLSGGRTWWAHFEFTRINIARIILRNKFEDCVDLGAFGRLVQSESLRRSLEISRRLAHSDAQEVSLRGLRAKTIDVGSIAEFRWSASTMGQQESGVARIRARAALDRSI
jgi:hypothetical protein